MDRHQFQRSTPQANPVNSTSMSTDGKRDGEAQQPPPPLAIWLIMLAIWGAVMCCTFVFSNVVLLCITLPPGFLLTRSLARIPHSYIHNALLDLLFLDLATVTVQDVWVYLRYGLVGAVVRGVVNSSLITCTVASAGMLSYMPAADAQTKEAAKQALKARCTRLVRIFGKPWEVFDFLTDAATVPTGWYIARWWYGAASEADEGVVALNISFALAAGLFSVILRKTFQRLLNRWMGHGSTQSDVGGLEKIMTSFV